MIDNANLRVAERVLRKFHLLDELEQRILRERYGLANRAPRALNDIAKDLHIEPETVRLKETRALEALGKEACITQPASSDASLSAAPQPSSSSSPSSS